MEPIKQPAKTKIVCTLGPASSSPEKLRTLIEAGMDVARLNFSHGTHGDHSEMLTRLRNAADESGEPIAILLDLQGPKIRTGKVQEPYAELLTGTRFTITTEDCLGNSERASTTYAQLPSDVKEGDMILIDDGTIQLRVLSSSKNDVVTEVIHGGKLKSHKGINLPGVAVSSPSFTEKDIRDLEFGIAHDIDYVALSFVRSAEDVRTLKELIIQKIPFGKKLPIIAKIEKPEALDNIDAIIREADGIMVARGDLGVECHPEDVPIAQKMICRKANEAGKPVIIATQMLESMINNPRPTRAEASDVANAVLDGADAVMLSGETSVGSFPVEAVRTMNAIVRKAEETCGDKIDLHDSETDGKIKEFSAIARSACLLAKRIGAAAIVSITHSGETAKLIARYRPCVRIIAVTDRDRTMRRLNLIWGVQSLRAAHLSDTDTTFGILRKELLQSGYVQVGDTIVITAGIPLLGRGTTNTITVEKIV